MNMTDKVYSKYFFTRGDQEWAKANLDQLQRIYLMSESVTSTAEEVSIPIMKGFVNQQIKPDTDHDPKQWWEVINRTTGQIVSPNQWCFNKETDMLTIVQAQKWHRYTVNFLAYQLWDPVHMYNHITNNWDAEHHMPYDPRHPETRSYILKELERWLSAHPDTDVVRITTFFYNFTLVFNDMKKEKYVDWFGYSATVSPLALKEFEKEKGYKLRPEDLIDQGYYNSPFRIPSKEFLDWMRSDERRVGKACIYRRR